MSAADFAPTDDLGAAYRRCDPWTPLQGEALEHWYVDCFAERGVEGFIADIAREIKFAGGGAEQAGRPFAHALVSGHRGSGKSTELLRLKQLLENDGYCVLYVNASPEVTRELDAEAAIMVTMRQCVEQLDDLGVQLKENQLTAIAEWFGQTLVERAQVEDAEVRVGAEVGVGASALLKLLADFKGYIKRGTQQRLTFKVEYMRYLSDLAAHLNELLASARLELQKASRCDLVLILDGLDRVESVEHQTEIFVEYRELFANLLVHAVLTAPISMVCSPHATQLQEAFGLIDTLPSIKVQTPNGLQAARRIVLKRCSEKLFEEDALDELCRSSGGDVRHLVHLVREAIARTDMKIVTSKAARRAISAMSMGFGDWLKDSDYDLLAQYELDPGLPATDQPALSLLFNLALLSYRNDKRWYGVHPAIQRLSRFEERLATARQQRNEEAPGGCG